MKSARTIDPEIQAVRDEARAKIAQVKFAQSSAGIRDRFLNVSLAKLTQQDREKIADVLADNTSPRLPVES